MKLPLYFVLSIAVAFLILAGMAYPMIDQDGIEQDVEDGDGHGGYHDSKGGIKIIRDIKKEGKLLLGFLDKEAMQQEHAWDGSNPRIATRDNMIVVAYEKFRDGKDIALMLSSDYGNRWFLISYPMKGNQLDPGVDLTPDGDVICVFGSDGDDSKIYILEGCNMKGRFSWTLSWLDLHLLECHAHLYRFSDLHDLSIDIADDQDILIAGIGDVENLSSREKLEDVPIVLYSCNKDTFSLVFSDDTAYTNLKDVDVSFEEDAYITCEIDGGGFVILYFPYRDFDEGWKELDMMDRDYVIYRNPSVLTWGSNALVVFESISGGNSDITYLFSNDHGSNWVTGSIDVACSSLDERDPSISYHDGRFLLSFERDGEVFVTESEDLYSWDEPESVGHGKNPDVDNLGLVWEDGNRVWVRSYGSKKEVKIVREKLRLSSSKNNLFEGIRNILSMEIQDTGQGSDPLLVKVFAVYRYRKEPLLIALEDVKGLKEKERMRLNITLFHPFDVIELTKAMLRFAGVRSLVVEICAGDASVDTFSLNISYSDLFPRFARFEDLVLDLLQKGYEGSQGEIVNMLSDYL